MRYWIYLRLLISLRMFSNALIKCLYPVSQHLGLKYSHSLQFRKQSFVSSSFYRRIISRSKVTAASDGTPSISSKDIEIPLDKVDFQFARSSGPGGQNVNKVNTKAELRFHVMSADWLKPEVKQRLLQYQSNKISNLGELIVSSQEHRTQAKNKDDCIEKLKEMVAEAMLTPKEREMWVGISEKGKQKRKEEKRKRGDVKNSRRAGRGASYDD